VSSKQDWWILRSEVSIDRSRGGGIDVTTRIVVIVLIDEWEVS
jgi:hypothetical protein